jgi:hypothetical protein
MVVLLSNVAIAVVPILSLVEVLEGLYSSGDFELLLEAAREVLRRVV